MLKINEFEKKIKRFQEDFDYSIEYISGGLKLYSFHSEEAKKDLWESEYVPNDGFEYKVEKGNGGFRAYKTTSYQKGGNKKPTKPINFPFNPLKSNNLPLSSDSGSNSNQIISQPKNDYLGEEFIVGEDMEITPDNKVSSNAYAIRRKQEGDKIVEDRRELDYSPFGMSRKESDAPKIMEINGDGEMMEVESSSLVENRNKNWVGERRESMIEARNNFQSVFTEERKKALLEAREAFIEANKANIPFYNKK